MSRIKVRFPKGTVTVRLRPERTSTTEGLLKALPFSSKISTWGEEVYFTAPFHVELEEDARADMEVGEVAYWPDGDAVAIFFGRTPASTDESPKAYSACNIIGVLEGDISALRSVRPGDFAALTIAA